MQRRRHHRSRRARRRGRARCSRAATSCGRSRSSTTTGRVAAGKALDIAQAAPIEGFATELAGANDVSTAAGAAIVVLADRAGGGEWQGEDGLTAAEAADADRVGRGHRVRRRGTARAGRARRPRAALRARAAVRLGAGSARRRRARARRAGASTGRRATWRCRCSACRRDHTVIPWADATIGGFALTRLLDEPSRRRLAARVAALWPPGPYALAAAAAMADRGDGRALAPDGRAASSRPDCSRKARHARADRRDAGPARSWRDRRSGDAVAERGRRASRSTTRCSCSANRVMAVSGRLVSSSSLLAQWPSP